jgi:hypothetical protein
MVDVAGSGFFLGRALVRPVTHLCRLFCCVLAPASPLLISNQMNIVLNKKMASGGSILESVVVYARIDSLRWSMLESVDGVENRF